MVVNRNKRKKRGESDKVDNGVSSKRRGQFASPLFAFHIIFFPIDDGKKTVKHTVPYALRNSGDIKKLFDGHEFDKFELFSWPICASAIIQFYAKQFNGSGKG